MTIPYTQRREYRLKLVEQLPPDLHGKISLRYIETFIVLPAQARQLLEKAVLAGLTQIPRAIRLLKDNPQLSLAELLSVSSGETPSETPGETPSETPDIKTLAAVIRSRFQSMPEIAARALAQSPPMEDVLNVQVAFRKAIESPHIRSDFVSATLWSLLQSSLAQLETFTASNSLSILSLRQGGGTQ